MVGKSIAGSVSISGGTGPVGGGSCRACGGGDDPFGRGAFGNG